nr:Ig-like domain-containing protein [Lachnospiraceae bacterium]
MRKRIIAFAVVTVMLINCFLSSVGEGVVSNAATKVKLSATKKTLTVGSSAVLKVKNTKKKVTWSTSKKSVCTVKKKTKYKATIKAKKVGTATITAKVNKKKYKCKVTVKAEPVAVSSISLSSSKEIILVGEYAFVDNVITPKSATNKAVTWTSTNTSVCDVNNGVIYGKSAGNAVVTATADNKTATCTIIVEDLGSISNYRLERNAADNGYNLSFSLTSKNGASVKANGTAHIGIYNTNKESQFKKDYFFTDADFVNRASNSYISPIYMCSIPILDSDYDLTASSDGLISLSLDLLSGNDVSTAINYISALKKAASSNATIAPITDITDPTSSTDTKEVVSEDASKSVNILSPYIEYDSTKKVHNVVFYVKRADANSYTSATGYVDIGVNNAGASVYTDKITFSSANFGYRKDKNNKTAYMATVPLKEANIKEGATDSGIASVLIYIANATNSDETILRITNLPKTGSNTNLGSDSVTSIKVSDMSFVTGRIASANIKMLNSSSNAIKASGEAYIAIYKYDSKNKETEVVKGNKHEIVPKNYSLVNNQYVYTYAEQLADFSFESGYTYKMAVIVTSYDKKTAKELCVITDPSKTTTTVTLDSPTYNATTKKATLTFKIANTTGAKTEYVSADGTASLIVYDEKDGGTLLFSKDSIAISKANFTGTTNNYSGKLEIDLATMEASIKGTGVFKATVNLLSQTKTASATISSLPKATVTKAVTVDAPTYDAANKKVNVTFKAVETVKSTSTNQKYTGTASVVITDGNSSTVLFTKSGISITSSNYDSNANGSFSVDVSSI